MTGTFDDERLAYGPDDLAGAVNDPLPDEPWTELGYAHRLVHVYGSRLRYVPEWRRWLVWDGQRWGNDISGQSERWAKVIARRITSDALGRTDRQERQAAERLARRGESAAGVAGVLALARTESEVVAPFATLDTDPFLLNCRNGVLDLRTGKLGPHDPALLLTKMTGADYDPHAAGPEFDKFLQRVQPEEHMRSYLARLLGHSLEGRIVEHVLPIFHGEGANGKSTLIGAVLGALGDYCEAADPELLTARTFDAHPTGVADLFGLRLAVLHESDAGRRLAEGTVKRLTGGDPVKARRMREDFWSFDPSHTFVMLTNHRPIVAGQDEGIWRRLRLIPWNVVIPAEDRDEGLPDRLLLELSAVLAWLVDGYRDWRTQGLCDPDLVKEATRGYRAESDALQRFIDEKCTAGHGSVGATELFKAWESWCLAEGEEPGSQKALAADLQRKGFDNSTHDGRGLVRWKPLCLPAGDR